MFFIVLVLVLIGCEKKYIYVESGINHSLLTGDKILTKERNVFKSENDSIAYFLAYKKFLISQEVERRMIKKLGRSNYTPKSYILYNTDEIIIDESIFTSNINSLKLKLENEINHLNP